MAKQSLSENYTNKANINFEKSGDGKQMAQI
jgi:hypothetical protein